MKLLQDVSAYARLRARIERGDARDQVLKEIGITPTQWVAVQRRWLRALAVEADRGDETLASRYQEAFYEVLGTKAQEPDSEERPAPAATPMPIVAPVAPVPSPSVDMTGMLPAFTALGAATPFRGARDAPPRVSEEVAAEAQSMVGMTTAGGPALTDEEVLAEQAAAQDLDTTAAVSALEIDDEPAFPFEKATSQWTAPAAAAEDVADEAGDMMGETAFVAALTDEELSDGLPFEAERRNVELSIEQYASLLAELSVNEPARDEIYGRYAVNAESFATLQQTWTGRFRDDPAVYGRFRALFDEYTGWLTRRR